MLPVLYDTQSVEAMIHERHIEAEHERLVLAAIALRAHERPGRFGRLSPLLDRISLAFGAHPADPNSLERRN